MSNCIHIRGRPNAAPSPPTIGNSAGVDRNRPPAIAPIGLSQPPDLAIPEATHQVIVHHPHRLHMRINHRRADKREPPLLQVLAERVRLRRSRRNLPHRLPPVHPRPPVDEPPCIRVKAAELLLERQKRPRVPYRRLNLQPVADDPRIQRQLLNSLLRIARHFCRIEPAERPPVSLPLPQHDRPAQSRLRRFQHQEFEVPAVLVHRHTPLAIVILHHQRIIRSNPRTATPLRSANLARLLRLRHPSPPPGRDLAKIDCFTVDRFCLSLRAATLICHFAEPPLFVIPYPELVEGGGICFSLPPRHSDSKSQNLRSRLSE